jgi:hypothetical protein
MNVMATYQSTLDKVQYFRTLRKKESDSEGNSVRKAYYFFALTFLLRVVFLAGVGFSAI